jgi:hypothetical protein
MRPRGKDGEPFHHGEHGGRKNRIVLFASELGYSVDYCMEHESGALEESHLLHSELTGQIIAAAVDVHRELGPGLLESA